MGNVIHAAGRLTAKAMILSNGDQPGREWMFGLDDKSHGQVCGAIQALSSLIEWGDPNLQLVEIASKCGLRALVVHDAVRPVPLTLLGHLDENTLWIATGHRAHPHRLSAEQIAAADNIAAEWLAS